MSSEYDVAKRDMTSVEQSMNTDNLGYKSSNVSD
jgi:hypothetical protein